MGYKGYERKARIFYGKEFNRYSTICSLWEGTGYGKKKIGL
jgi:hypothetical protein